jgi:HD superfamily phosphohydrolase YqeK
MTGLPPWAVVTPARRAHIERVVGLMAGWASSLRVPEVERTRWLKAAWLHDSLRDATAANELAHGPMAAERAARDGETDQGVLDAVRYHSIGYARWEDVGRMLYLADYLEPGRSFDRTQRAALAARVPTERDAVLQQVAARRVARVIDDRWPLLTETVDFWNVLVRS